MALSHFSFYIIGLVWGIHFRRFWFPWTTVIGIFHLIFFAMIWGPLGLSRAEFSLLLPLSGTFGLLVGYWLAHTVNMRRLIFLKDFSRYGWWIPLVLLELVAIHALLLFWELNELFGTPANYIIYFVATLVLIPALYFCNRRSSVFFYRDERNVLCNDDGAAETQYLLWGAFHLGATLIWMVVRIAAPDFREFWISLIVFLLSFIMQWLVGLWAHSYEWKLLSIARSDCDGLYTNPNTACTLIHNATDPGYMPVPPQYDEQQQQQQQQQQAVYINTSPPPPAASTAYGPLSSYTGDCRKYQ